MINNTYYVKYYVWVAIPWRSHPMTNNINSGDFKPGKSLKYDNF